MDTTDPRGNPVSTNSSAAQEAAERALERMMSFYGVPLDDLDAAVAADPCWALPHAMKAGYLLSLTEPSLAAEATSHLDAAIALAADATPREQDHIAAVQALAAGDWQGAADRWRAIAAAHPRDALALQWGHLIDFYRGDAASLEDRIAAALPAWPRGDPWRPYVASMHAFGLEENGRYAQAESAGREALAANPRVPWAIHAVAHVMEMTGRHDDGARWMEAQRAAWGEDNGFFGHLGWHEALFALEALDHARALAVFDRYLAAPLNAIGLQRIDAASLLWRLSLQGADVGSRFADLVATWPLDAARDAGRSTFNDLHVVMAHVGVGEPAAARRWIDAARERSEAGGGWNREVMNDAGHALLGAFVAYGEGRDEDAAAAIGAVLGSSVRIGGSHAQRDVLEQTLFGAARRGGMHDRVAPRLAARAARKPTPLTAYWQRR